MSEQTWAKAMLLGRARERENRYRSRKADRGAKGNQLADLYGALGELILLEIVESSSSSEAERDAARRYMTNHLFRPGSGKDVEGADLVLEENGRRYGIDAKTFDCETWKKYFAINASKHDRLSRYCHAYLGILVPLYGQRCAVAKLIPYQEVATWRVFRLQRNGEGDPSRNLPINTFLASYFDQSPNLAALRAARHREDEIERLVAEDGDDSPRAELIKAIRPIADYL